MNTGIRYNCSYRNQVHQVKEETQELATTAQTGIRYNSSNRNQVQHGIQDLGTTDKTGNRYNRQNRNQVQHRKQELDTSGIGASVWECCKETQYSINPANFELACRQFCLIWCDEDKSNNDLRATYLGAALEWTSCASRSTPALHVADLQGYQSRTSFVVDKLHHQGDTPCMQLLFRATYLATALEMTNSATRGTPAQHIADLQG